MSDIRDYQVDHLLLLVGSNPVPNAVAGKLLTRPEGTITLLHSHAKDSFELAKRLRGWFLKSRDSGSTIDLIEVADSDASSVYHRVSEKLKQYESPSIVRVGLNYTGATKVMSVHVYRALENWAKSGNGKRDAIFSYLDARTLQMRFDQVPGRDATSFYVGLQANIGIHDLLGLHNWKQTNEPTITPELPQSAAALVAVQSNPNDATIWTEWLSTELFGNAMKQVPIPAPFWIYQSDKELLGQYDVKQPGRNWKNNTDLRKLKISWPKLSALKETMSNELGQSNAEYLDLTAAKEKRCKDAQDFCKWLSGTWLESAVLSALQNCPQELYLKECCMDLQITVSGNGAGDTHFQFDVVARRGYQLFAFSCTTESKNKGLLKQKLFEAYVRARQMGGDEACVALVCCATQEMADRLEDEMRRDMSPEGRIRVFGREDLKQLTEHIEDWVCQQSKEG